MIYRAGNESYRGRMDAKAARTENMRRLVEAAGGPTEWVRKYGGDRWTQAQVSQWVSLSKPKGIGHVLARRLEEAMGLGHAELDRPPGSKSHPAQLDLDRLGIALTAMDKALADRAIQGKLGTLADALQFAYLHAFRLEDPSSRPQRAMYDELVAQHLGGWNERSGDPETGTGKHRPAAAAAPKDRRRAG